MSEAGIRLGPLHVAWSRPLQGLRLVFGRGLQSRAVRPLASGLTRSLTAQRRNNWQLLVLPHVRLPAGRIFMRPYLASDREKLSKIPLHASMPNAKLTKHSRKTLVYGRKLGYGRYWALVLAE